MAENRAEYTNRIVPKLGNVEQLKENDTPRNHGDISKVHTGGKKLQVGTHFEIDICAIVFIIMSTVSLYTSSGFDKSKQNVDRAKNFSI